MKVSELQFDFPEDLIATRPERPTRVLYYDEMQNKYSEITISELLEKIPAGDVVVINDTKVLKRRVFAETAEILFLNQKSELIWEVLFPSKQNRVGDFIGLPQGRKLRLLEKGRPQLIETDIPLDESYFQQEAELPLPPYIQKKRGFRKTQEEDESWYQTAWAKAPGSLAAPTASLHFQQKDFEYLKQKGVHICQITLHVGLGTFLPVLTDDLNDHVMHKEFVEIPYQTWQVLDAVRSNGGKVWALGTTVARALESTQMNILQKKKDGSYFGETQLLIQPGYQWKIVDRLMTNFHQPESTLLALVASFIGLNEVKKGYQIAIEKKMRLFSYGDLSVWRK